MKVQILATDKLLSFTLPFRMKLGRASIFCAHSTSYSYSLFRNEYVILLSNLISKVNDWCSVRVFDSEEC